ncbi:hypothetical protein LOD99_11623 [Oopsacas minuta]|uniref:Odorant receptor n=1 Tax=Oopsacas minuta TaxID=111878 RepID=A0AAV7JLB9_9METZ|nr:hypothetical protein LOD99_11623 [Oopsacas minuta]
MNQSHVFHDVLLYGTGFPLGVTAFLVFAVSLGWLIYMSGKVKMSYRSWIFYKDYYKYNSEYFDVIMSHRNTYFKNVLIFLFLIVDVLMLLFVFIDGIIAETEKSYLHPNDTLSQKCRIQESTWLSFKLNHNHPEVSIIESLWQVLAVTEMTIFNMIYLVLIQTYSHEPQHNNNLIKLFSSYIPIEMATIFILNIFKCTVLLGRLAFTIFLQFHMILNIYYSWLLWQRLKRYKIDMTYFMSQESREFTVFDKVTIRYKWLTIWNVCLLQFIVLTLIAFTVVNVFGETILLNPCWLEEVYGCKIHRFDINAHVFRLVTYLIICVRDWAISAHLLYILVVQVVILLIHVVMRCRRTKTSGFVQINTPLSHRNGGWQ